MHRTNSFATCLCSLLLLSSGLRAAPQPLEVMPAPAQVRLGEGRVRLLSRPRVTFAGAKDGRLDLAAARALSRWDARMSLPETAAGSLEIRLDCRAPGPKVPDGTEDESYTLDVTAQGAVRLAAATDAGALHALETLVQLPRHDAGGWYLPVVSITDHPRFAWRGLLIDVARHWEPLEVIRRNIDAMAVVKLNILHLHLTDDQGFRIESRTHPELQAKGSDGLFFTQEEMRGLIAYAAERGIRVIPELDVPGHTTSWVVSHPELASAPGPYEICRHWGVFNPVLDPTNEATYALLGDFLGEMAALFPDRFMHIGGDENNGVQWSANPRIQAFIRDKGLRDNPGLHAYFNRRLAAILAAHGKRIIGWDEIANPELPHDCVIDSWRGTEAIASSTAQGFDCLRANGFYIDLCYPAAQHYLADPIADPSTLSDAQRSHVLGGEATMWGEWVTPETIDSRIWPRTAAIAERLWSAADVRDVPDMYRRLAFVSARLDEAGSLHLRNRGLMLRFLAGAELSPAAAAKLRTFVDLIEPVKGYKRFDLQVGSSQQKPLRTLADAAIPESEPSRILAADLQALLFTGGGVNRTGFASVKARLADWAAAAGDVGGPLAAAHAGLADAVGPARNLAAVCAAGIEAAQALERGTPLASDRAAACLAALDLAAKDSPTATMIPIAEPVRLLITAAYLQGPGVSEAGSPWETLVRSTAAKPDALPPSKVHYN